MADNKMRERRWTMQPTKLQRILRKAEVLLARGRSNTSHYADIKGGLFTSPVVIGPNAVGWPENEVAAINAARISGWSDDQIRDLVSALEAARVHLMPKLEGANGD